VAYATPSDVRCGEAKEVIADIQNDTPLTVIASYARYKTLDIKTSIYFY
jgi:hypothetical protein